MAEPWMKFYTSDWRADPRLKMCSPAARGMWIEMICLMHEATPYGQLLIHGQSPNVAQLASLTGIQVAECSDLVAELERNGVFSRTREGVIYSRKLVRMEAKTALARKVGKKGGNPALCKDTINSASVNRDDNSSLIPRIPDTRYQNISPSGDTGELAEAVKHYNEAASRSGWPRVGRMSKPRFAALRARLSEADGISGWHEALRKAEASGFINSSKTGWFCFDWLIKQENFTKIMEGNYDNRSGRFAPASSALDEIAAAARAR